MSRIIDPSQQAQFAEFTESAPSDHHLSDRTQEAEDYLEQVEQDLLDCRSQLRQNKRELRQATIQAQSFETQLDQARDHLAQNSEYMQAQATEIQRLQVQLESIPLLKRGYEAQLEQNSVQIKQLQAKLMQGLVDGRWTPAPDDKIRDQLTSLNFEIKNWSKDWAIQTFEQIRMDPEAFSTLAQFSQAFENVLSTSTAPIPPKLMDKLPAILLSAALANEIQLAFFDDPFFCTGSENRDILWNILCDALKGKHLHFLLAFFILNPSSGCERSSPVAKHTAATTQSSRSPGHVEQCSRNQCTYRRAHRYLL